MFRSFLVKEALWRPSIYIKPSHRAILVMPGSNLPTQLLDPGWQFHWPLLSVIRIFHFEPITVRIGAASRLNRTDAADEPVVAVTKDHQLMKVSVDITLELGKNITANQLAKLNRYHANNIIRPLLRVAIRDLVSRRPAVQQSNQQNSELQDIAGQLLGKYGILVTSVHNIHLAPYQPPKTTGSKDPVV